MPMARLLTLLLAVLTALPQRLAGRVIVEHVGQAKKSWRIGIPYWFAKSRCVSNDNKIGTEFNSNLKQCARECSTNSECKSFEYSGTPENGNCHLTKTIQYGQCKNALKNIYSKPLFEFFKNSCVTEDDNIIATHPSMSADECKDMCLLTPDCKAVHWERYFPSGSLGNCRPRRLESTLRWIPASADSGGCNGQEFNRDVYVMHAGDHMMVEPFGSIEYKFLKGCVHGANIATFSGKTGIQCQDICNTMSTCIAYELADGEKGPASQNTLYDCRPQRTINNADLREDCGKVWGGSVFLYERKIDVFPWTDKVNER